MRHLLFSPTEVFAESVGVIDDILEDGTDRMEYIRNLWQNLLIRYKLWSPGAPDDEEYEMAVSSVFYVVAIVLSRHKHDYFCNKIKDALLAEIDSHTSIVKQEEDKVIVCLSKHADGIEQWLDSYADSESYLSDEIDDAANGRKRRTRLKVKLSDNNTNVKEKQNNAKDYSRYSFQLIPQGRFKDKVSLALELLHKELKGKKFVEDDKEVEIKENVSQTLSIKEKNKIAFNAIFSGSKTDCHIIWSGTEMELGYFINQLEARGALSWDKGPRKWQVVRNRIWHKKKTSKTDDVTEENNYSYCYEPFGDKSFNGKLVPADTSKLDTILDMIAPPVETNQIGKEIGQQFRDYANYEENNDNGPGEKLSNGFRDRSHKAKK